MRFLSKLDLRDGTREQNQSGTAEEAKTVLFYFHFRLLSTFAVLLVRRSKRFGPETIPAPTHVEMCWWPKTLPPPAFLLVNFE